MTTIFMLIVVPPLLLLLEFWMLITALLHYRFARRLFEKMFYYVARFFLTLIAFILHIKVHLSQNTIPIPPRFLLLANHQSYLDILALVKLFPHHNIRFIAKQELGRWVPCITTYITLLQHTLITRKITRNGQAETQKILHKLTQRAKDEELSIAIFPEGSRSVDGTIKPFRSGAIKEILFKDPHLPVVLIAIDGAYKLATIFDAKQDSTPQTYRIEVVACYNDTWDTREKIKSLSETSLRKVTEVITKWRKKGLSH